MKGLPDRFAYRLFLVSVILLTFLYGAAVGLFHIFPFQLFVDAADGYTELCKQWRIGEIGNQLPGHMAQLDGPPFPPAIINTDRACRGLNIVNQIETGGVVKPTGEALVLKVMDMDGKVLHRWIIDWFNLWPDAKHVPPKIMPKSRPGTHVDAQVIMDNGDLVFTFTDLGLMRLDRDGNVVWRLPYLTHHSVTQDDDGNLWVCGWQRHSVWSERYPHQMVPFNEEMLLEVSPQGKILHEWSVQDILIKNGMHGLLRLGNLADKSTTLGPLADILHLNKVELFPAKRMKEGFFKKGDILVSLRNINTVFVFNRETEKIKFLCAGKFVRQHDPVFIDGNSFSVFDNNVAVPPECNPQSRIVIVSAPENTVKTFYEGTPEHPFYSVVCGKHHWLPNGNALIVESCGGRAFEVDRHGKIVWQYINYIDKQRGVVGLVQDVQRLPSEYARFYTGKGSGDSKPQSAASGAKKR